MKKKILIIGGKGFIGSHICRYLKMLNYNVVASSRKQDIDCVKLDLTKDKVSDCNAYDCIINLAVGSKETIIEGTKNLVNNLLQSSFSGKYIHFSTMEVFNNGQGICDDDTIPLPKTLYGIQKFEAEKILKSSPNSLKYLIVRPSCVVGKNSVIWYERPIQLLKQNRLGYLGSYGEGQANLIHINDLLVVINKLIESKFKRKAINLSGDYNISWNNYLKQICSQKKIEFKHIPEATINFEIKFLSYLFKSLELMKIKKYPPLTKNFIEVTKSKKKITSSFLNDVMKIKYLPINQFFNDN